MLTFSCFIEHSASSSQTDHKNLIPKTVSLIEMIVTFAGFCNLKQCRQAEACRFLNTWHHISEKAAVFMVTAVRVSYRVRR